MNGEIKRRTEVIALFPEEHAIVRPVGILLEQEDEWVVQCARYTTSESIAPIGADPLVSPADSGSPGSVPGR